MKAVLSSQSFRLLILSQKQVKLYFWLSANYFFACNCNFHLSFCYRFGLVWFWMGFFWWKSNKTSPVFTSTGSQAMFCYVPWS